MSQSNNEQIRFERYDSVMDEPELRPLLVLHIPDRHHVDPQALEELQAYMGFTYGAGVLLNRRTFGGSPRAPVLLGSWQPHNPTEVLLDVQPRLQQVFFNLDWLEEAL